MKSLLSPRTIPRLVLVFVVSSILTIGIVGPASAMMGDGSGTGQGGPMMGDTAIPGGSTDSMPGLVDGGPMGSMPGSIGDVRVGDMPVGDMPGPVDTMPGYMMSSDDADTHPHMFDDVSANDWYHPYAEHMADHGFMMGYAGGAFGGYDPVTRGQFSVIMARMMGLEPGEGSGFADMQGYWGADMVTAMVDAGLIRGYPDGTFHPDETITRAQMAAIMDRAWQSMHGDWAPTEDEMSAVHGQLHDIDGMWADEHIAHMYSIGVVQGDQMGQFRPWEPTNRAQASAMMWRWYELGGGS
jgi:hypothetical protein